MRGLEFAQEGLRPFMSPFLLDSQQQACKDKQGQEDESCIGIRIQPGAEGGYVEEQEYEVTSDGYEDGPNLFEHVNDRHDEHNGQREKNTRVLRELRDYQHKSCLCKQVEPVQAPPHLHDKSDPIEPEMDQQEHGENHKKPCVCRPVLSGDVDNDEPHQQEPTERTDATNGVHDLFLTAHAGEACVN